MPDLHTEPGADLDPDIRRFALEVAKAYAAHPPLDRLSLPEARAVCEVVRAPWTQGGPATAVSERRLATEAGEVRVRIHDPAPGPGLKPALVYLHGGGWVLFSLDTHDRVMREYAARAGVVVVGVDYALSPEARFPRALHQSVAVVRWLAVHGPEVGIDPGRLAAGGDSAGANLALASALLLRDGGEGERLRGVLLNYGAFDDRCSPEAVRLYGGPDYTLTAAELAGFFAAYLGAQGDGDVALARPIGARLEGLPPAFLTIPECDVLTEQSHLMAARLAEAGVPVAARTYPGATHSFLEAVSISPLAAQALQDGSDWLRATLEPWP